MRPPAVTPTPPRNDRRETPARSMLSVITVPPEPITDKTPAMLPVRKDGKLN
jgi:hypothetical protein